MTRDIMMLDQALARLLCWTLARAFCWLNDEANAVLVESCPFLRLTGCTSFPGSTVCSTSRYPPDIAQATRLYGLRRRR